MATFRRPRRLYVSSIVATVLLAIATASLKAQALRYSVHLHSLDTTSFDVSADGHTLAMSAGGNPIEIWDLQTLRRIRKVEDPSECNAVLSHDAKLLIFGGEYDSIKFTNVATGEQVSEINSPDLGSLELLAITPDGKSVIAWYYDYSTRRGTIRHWHLESGRKKADFRVSRERPSALAVSPDGKLLAAGTRRGDLFVWDLVAGQQKYQIQAHAHALVRDISFSGDGRDIATGGGDAVVRIWDADTGEKKLPLRGHGNEAVNAVAFSPDGKTVASAGDDGTIHIWNAKSGEAVMGLQVRVLGVGAQLVGAPKVQHMTFSPDGLSLITGDWHGTCRAWKIADPDGSEAEVVHERPVSNDTLSQAVGYYTGTAGQVDWLQARKLFIKAFRTADPLAVMWAAHLLNKGLCGFDRNQTDARRCATRVITRVKALANQGNVEAQFLYAAALAEGLGLRQGPAAQEAAKWYRQAALAGHTAASNNLGAAYATGNGVGRDDTEAVKWYFYAANAGDTGGMYNLAMMINDRRGIVTRDTLIEDNTTPWHGLKPKVRKKAAGNQKKDGEQADGRRMTHVEKIIHEMKKPDANSQRDVDADKTAGNQKKDGEQADERRMTHVEKIFHDMKNPESKFQRDVDADKAASNWYLRAAEMGDSRAMSELANSYQFGVDGLVKDRSEATKWYTKAIEKGDPIAHAALKLMNGDRSLQELWWDRVKIIKR